MFNIYRRVCGARGGGGYQSTNYGIANGTEKRRSRLDVESNAIVIGFEIKLDNGVVGRGYAVRVVSVVRGKKPVVMRANRFF